MPKVKRKLTAAERKERLAKLMEDDYEEEFDEPDPEPGVSEDIVVIRGTAAKSLLKALGVKDEDDDEEETEETEEEDDEENEDGEEEGDEEVDEDEVEVPKKSAKKAVKKALPQEPKPPSRNRYFGS